MIAQVCYGSQVTPILEQSRKYLSLALFPLALVTTLIASLRYLSGDAPPALLPLIITVAGFALVLIGERLLPRQAKPPEPGERRTDLAFVGLTSALHPVLQTAAAALVTLLASWTPGGLAAQLPLALGASSALLVSGFGDYWAHRLSHEWPWWWRLHAVHHAPHRMVALNNFRIHPLDLALKIAFRSVPVLVLGFSAEAVALSAAVQGLCLSFQHADMDLRHHHLNYLFSTNSLHRLHHSALKEEGNSNYGAVLSIFDLAFSTYRWPNEHLDPERMGLFDEQNYPVHSVARATLAPFCWQRCTQAPSPCVDSCARSSS